MSEEQDEKKAAGGESELTGVLGKGLKMCLLCEHFEWDPIDMSCGSEMTGCWLEGGATCDKGHFSRIIGERPDDKRDMLALFLKAEKCADYLPNMDFSSGTTKADKNDAGSPSAGK